LSCWMGGRRPRPLDCTLVALASAVLVQARGAFGGGSEAVEWVTSEAEVAAWAGAAAAARPALGHVKACVSVGAATFEL
jgi:hypothetical protein